MSDDAPKRVAVLIGNRFGTVDEADLPKMPKGTRVLTAKEAKAREDDEAQQSADKAVQERYDALPTYRKVAGGVGAVTGLLNPLTIGANPDAPPEMTAYNQGVTSGLTGGLAHGLVRQGVDAVAGHDAGDKYAQVVEEQKAASPIAHGAGAFAGTAAGLVSGAGGVAENLAERGLARAGLEGASSVAGRAATSAAKLGVRGAVEGGIIGGGEYAGEQLLQDKDIATDKLFASVGTGSLYGGATGAVLGGGGSLLASGAKSGLARVLARQGTDALTEGGEAASASVPRGKIAEAMANPTAAGRTMANELAFDALGATKLQRRAALANGLTSDEVGGYMNRTLANAVGNDASAWQVGKVGRADDLLGLIQEDKAGRIATGLSDAVKGTPARVDMGALYRTADQIGSAMQKDPTAIAGADTFRNRVLLEMQALQNAGKVAADGTIDAADAFYTRSSLAKQAYEVKKVSGAAGDAYKSFLRAWDDATIKAIDQAGEAAGKNSVGDNIRYWKREWQLASAAEKAATGGAERIAGNNFFGLREGIALATGLATGHAVLPLAGALAFKVAKERGKAVLAQSLYQAAERGTLARLVARTDEQIARASKGLLTAPPKGIARDVMPPPRQLTTKALARVAAFQADPDGYIDHASRQVTNVSAHSPEIADGIVQRQVQAMTFLSSKVPTQGDPDPLDPHPRIHMTPSEEATFARYAYYTEKPDRFFAEVARGKLTPEGAEVAHALMPRAFEDLQAQTFDALTTQLARGNRLPFRQRELIGQLLDFAATPAQRPEHRAFLQQNVSDVLASNERTAPAAPKARRHTMSQNGSALDRLEAGGPGHR